MASSWSFFPDGDTIIKAALRRIRAYDPEAEETITTTQYDNARETLNMILSSWQADGLHVWTIKTSSALALTSSQGSYTVGASGADWTLSRPMDIIRAWLRDSNNIDRPLEIISKAKYDMLSSKTSEGTPVSLYFDAAYDGASNQGANSKATIYLWPEPDSTAASEYDVFLVYQRPLLDFNASTDHLDMPQEWYNAIRLALAHALAPEYGMPVMDQDRLEKEAMLAKELAMGWDREKTSLFLQPNTDYC